MEEQQQQEGDGGTDDCRLTSPNVKLIYIAETKHQFVEKLGPLLKSVQSESETAT